MIRPQQAPVTPRVVSPETGEIVPLDEGFVSDERPRGGAVEIVGGPGAGKTTALEHLAATEGAAEGVAFLDEPDPAHLLAAADQGLVVFTSRKPSAWLARRSFLLASWSDDDLIEYLLAMHPGQCRSVMSRAHRAPDRNLLQGVPALWRVVLDRMAEDPSAIDARDALRRYFDSTLTEDKSRRLAEDYCLAAMAYPKSSATREFRPGILGVRDAQLVRLLRHRIVKLLLGVDALARLLETGAECPCLEARLPRDLVSETAAAVASNTAALDTLRNTVAGSTIAAHAMAASILHATGMGWIPKRNPVPPHLPHLEGAYLKGASWPEIDLSNAALERADLTAANLTGAKLDDARAMEASLRHACLRDASVNRLFAFRADLAYADVSNVTGHSAILNMANLAHANLEDADLTRASFQGAMLAGARFRRANLHKADFRHAVVGDADFTEADLRQADLEHAKLAEACFSGARLAGANLTGCDLEDMDLPDAEFEGATLTGALLSASRMPRANFRKADLRKAGLADIDWEGADLRQADLRQCTFHLGSSRSGLVDSPIASEGTRTGFYTDDFDARHFQSPEEIRKANLRRADLRGARIEGTDFYLVDLRGALFDDAQAEHFRCCKAILADRA